MSSHSWRAGEGVVVRTPLLPLSTLADWTAAADPRSFLAALLLRPEVNEAIFIASPSLHGAIRKWREQPDSTASQRAERSLCKYIARMSGRSTPFGLFSGVSAGALGRESKLELAPRGEYRRRTRLDNDYLFVLVGELARAAEIRARVIVRPNSSLYRIAGRLRYARARLEGRSRSYHLASVEPEPYLEATLARAAAGARIDELAAALVEDDITIDEARAYLTQLVDAQLLVPELGIHVTGPEPIDGLVAQLRDAAVDQPVTLLEAARSSIAAIDEAGVGNPPERYRAIATSLGGLPAKVDLARLFQVDMVKPAAITLGHRVAAELAQTIEKLSRVARASEGESLGGFRRAFRERYEDREVPLAEALDEESGIGFEAARGPGSEGSPLLAGIGWNPGPRGEPTVGWRGLNALLLKRFAEAIGKGDREIVLTDAELDAVKLDRPARLPDALAVMTRLEATPEELARGELTILYEGAVGPSGARLLGRFCHASPEIHAMVRAHHAAEEALAPGALFAEIVHLNEGRIGNIICRPVLRAHEIVFLGVSGVPRDRQLALDDLVVSVRNDRIALRSKRLDREIVPRLTTAHNYRLRSLGVYRFLCALASQHYEHGMFSWSVVGDVPFTPRVRLGRVVLARATWHLGGRELAPLTAAVREAGKQPAATPKVAAAVAALRAERGLPRFVVIAAGDNELPIDLDNPLLALAFADEVAGSPRVQLREMFPAPDKLVVKGPEGGFANEVIVMFTRERPTSPPPLEAPRIPTIRRQFAPGSEWLYAKIYCGEQTTDRVLRAAIAPLVREALGAGDADRWFFIRYADPDPHVRVRFHGDPERLAGRVLPALHRAFERLQAEGIARKLVLDSYDREIERYGGDHAIELVEQVFWRDSEAVLGIVEQLDGDTGGDARWRLALRGIDSLLDALGLSAEAREAIAVGGRDALGAEMNADTAFWSRIGDRFEAERASLDLLFARDPERDRGHALEPGFRLLAERDAHIAELSKELHRREAAGELAPGVAGFAWSVTHMHVNRLLHGSQRAHELVLYDFLRRLYTSRRARARAR